MNMLDRFKGLNNAQASSNRIPPPSLGRAAYLINSVRMHDNRKGGYRVEVLATSLWCIEPGTTADGDKAGSRSLCSAGIISSSSSSSSV